MSTTARRSVTVTKHPRYAEYCLVTGECWQCGCATSQRAYGQPDYVRRLFGHKNLMCGACRTDWR